MLSISSVLLGAQPPQGFFLTVAKSTGAPAFYDLRKHEIQSVTFRQTYSEFIDTVLDTDRERLFFSARRERRQPFRLYVKDWPDGEERAIYENPLGPFRFLLSPDGHRLAMQIMGPSAWPTIAVLDWETGNLTEMGQGYSPDWSNDSQRLLFLRLPGSLPAYLHEYRIDTATTTQLLKDPVLEAVYTEDPEQIVIKTAARAKKCDLFQLWNRRTRNFGLFSIPEGWRQGQPCSTQRNITAFPGRQFLLFKEAPNPTGLNDARLIVTDLWGGRLQTIEPEDWQPQSLPVDPTWLVIGEDPMWLVPADGTGGKREIKGARLVRPAR